MPARRNALGDFSQGNGVTVEWHEGRFPANLILDEEAAKMLDEQSGQSKSYKAATV